jgi:hypothetical protein
VAPIGPTAPVAPIGPAGPCGPTAPAGPAGPIGPIAPVAPVAPVCPAGPCGPIAPAGPAAPVAPAGPTGPAGPAAPVAPAGPAGPAGPIGPAGPAGPCGPMGPCGPCVPLPPVLGSDRFTCRSLSPRTTFTVLVSGLQFEFGMNTVTVCIPKRTPSMCTGVRRLTSFPSNVTCAPEGLDEMSRWASCARKFPHPPAKIVKHATATTLGSSFLSRIFLSAPFPAENFAQNSMLPQVKYAHATLQIRRFSDKTIIFSLLRARNAKKGQRGWRSISGGSGIEKCQINPLNKVRLATFYWL